MATANPKSKTPSQKCREKGNTFYQRSFDGNRRNSVKEDLLHAIGSYQEAVEYAESDRDMTSANKNLGMAKWKLAEYYWEVENGETLAVQLFDEGLNLIAIALNQSQGDSFDEDWRIKTKTSLMNCIQNYVDALSNGFQDDFPQQVQWLIKTTEKLPLGSAKGQMYYEWANLLFKESLVLMSEKKNFMKALYNMKECYYPLEQIKKLLKDDTLLLAKVQEMEEDIRMNTCVAESIQSLDLAECMFIEVVEGSEELNLEGVFTVLDKFTEAAILTRELNVEIEAIARSRMAKINRTFLKNENQAKHHALHSITLAHSLLPQSFRNEKWYQEANEILQSIQLREKRAEEAEHDKERQKHLQNMVKEMQILKELRDCQDTLRLIRELPEKLPAKHRVSNSKSGEGSEVPGKGIKSEENRGEIKKILQKLIVFYHPDKVDKEVWGLPYFFLCEEIAKVLTQKYEGYKNVS